MNVSVQQIEDHGREMCLSAPLISLGDEGAFRRQAARALQAFTPIIRPLGLTVVRCFRELDTCLPADDDWPGDHCILLLERGVDERVALDPWYGSVENAVRVPSVNGEALLSCFEGVTPPRPGLEVDWLAMYTAAVAVRCYHDFEAIKLRPWGRVVKPYEPGWFAGPVELWGWGVNPPAEFRFDNHEGQVELDVSVYWGPWTDYRTPEHAAIKSAVDQLREEGWSHAGAYSS